MLVEHLLHTGFHAKDFRDIPSFNCCPHFIQGEPGTLGGDHSSSKRHTAGVSLSWAVTLTSLIPELEPESIRLYCVILKIELTLCLNILLGHSPRPPT